MSLHRRSFLLAGAAALAGCRRESPRTAPSPPALSGDPAAPWFITPGGLPPDWSLLEPWQEKITHLDFLRLMDSVIAGDRSWTQWIDLQPDRAVIRTARNRPELPPFTLRFATPGTQPRGPRYWRRAEELPALTNPQRPLESLRIALDPGHIGGAWAAMEERNFNDGAVKEGEITLKAARALAPMLEAAGATVTFVRDSLQPQTEPDWSILRKEARASLLQSGAPVDDTTIERESRRLFCRSAEIRARAAKVNHTLRPDLVICMHFNAGGPFDNHLHILAHGCITADEFMLDDQRLEALQRLIQSCADTELPLCLEVARSMAAVTGLPAYTYTGNNARGHPGSPYLWMRNLLANRLYQCPVVFCEPWVMNNPELTLRTRAGDYEGESMVAGKMRPSLSREYALAVLQGLTAYYAGRRPRSS